MICKNITLAAIPRECKDNAGGLKAIYVLDFDKLSGISIDGTSGQITGITAVTSTAKFVRWDFRKGTASMTSTTSIDEAAGTVFTQTDVALVFNKMEATKRLQMVAAMANDTVVIVRDQNNKLWFLGEDNPVTASAGGAESGTAMSDRNAYTLTFSDYARELPREVNMTTEALLELGID